MLAMSVFGCHALPESTPETKRGQDWLPKDGSECGASGLSPPAPTLEGGTLRGVDDSSQVREEHDHDSHR